MPNAKTNIYRLKNKQTQKLLAILRKKSRRIKKKSNKSIATALCIRTENTQNKRCKQCVMCLCEYLYILTFAMFGLHDRRHTHTPNRI